MIQKLQRRFTLLVLGVLLVILAGVVFAINYVNWKELTDQAEASLELIVKNNGQRPGMMDRPDGSFPPPWAQTQSSGTGDVVLDSQDWDDGEDEDAAEDAASDDKDEEVDGGNHYEDLIDDVLDEEAFPPGLQGREDMAFAANLSTYYCVHLDQQGSILRWTSDRQDLYTDQQVAELTRAVLETEKDFGRVGSQFYRLKETDSGSLLVVLDARMDKGSVEAVFRPFDLSQAVLQVALPFESTVFEAGKTMELDVPDGVMVKGDQDMIQQLVVILLSNAVKYSDDGGAIRVTLEARGPVLKVHNTGPAISPEVLPHIFDRFFRGDAAHNRETPGNGLGLAIAQNIMDAHKGKITAESSPEAGTTFTVTFA